jgi:hypothetical protein
MIENFETFPESTNTPPSDQWFRNYDHWKLGVLLEINSEQIKLSGQFWTLNLIPKEMWENSEYQNPREFCNLFNDGLNSIFQSHIKKLRPVEAEPHYELQFSCWVNFKFLRFVLQSSSYSCTCICKIMTYVGPICSSLKEKFAQYIRRAYKWWQSHSSP